MVGSLPSTATVIASACLALYANLWIAPAFGNDLAIKIEAKAIDNFQVGANNKTRFGQLKYLGGIEYWSDNDALGGISGIRLLPGGNRFLSVSDKGKWFSGTIKRDRTGKITGISNAKIAPLLDKKGKVITSKKKGDAEGIEIFNDRVLVSFERKSRIYNYKLDLEHLASKPKSFRPLIKKIKLPNNNGLEAITLLERQSFSAQSSQEVGSAKLSGTKIAVFSEHSLDKNGNIRGFISAKKKWQEFAVKASDDFKITDATLLPDGDILILERKFSLPTGPLIRIRRLSVADIKPGALVDGETIFYADSRFQIDNLEGISAWIDGQCRTVLTIVSDDNFSFLQRNLMLEFELLPSGN